jgi:hypothetical protein
VARHLRLAVAAPATTATTTFLTAAAFGNAGLRTALSRLALAALSRLGLTALATLTTLAALSHLGFCTGATRNHLSRRRTPDRAAPAATGCVSCYGLANLSSGLDRGIRRLGRGLRLPNISSRIPERRTRVSGTHRTRPALAHIIRI